MKRPMFQQRHYEAIARVMSYERLRMPPYYEGRQQWEAVMFGLTNLFEEDNPNFDREKFESACYQESRSSRD